jgi:hypothetical protein
MPPAVSNRASLRACVRWWLIPQDDGFEFTVASARKALGLASDRGELRWAIQAYLGHLLTTFGGDEAGGKCYRMLPIADRTPEHLLPI